MKIISLSRTQDHFLFSLSTSPWMSKVKRFSLFSSSEAENGAEDRRRVSKSPTAQSPTSSVEAESPDQKRSLGLW
jgi:hypothetical protein